VGWLRDAGLRAAGRLPGAKERVLQMKFKPMPFYQWAVFARCWAGARRTPAAAGSRRPILVSGFDLDEQVGGVLHRDG
jgi:hypothetical protein